jgi:hypothetical protein
MAEEIDEALFLNQDLSTTMTGRNGTVYAVLNLAKGRSMAATETCRGWEKRTLKFESLRRENAPSVHSLVSVKYHNTKANSDRHFENRRKANEIEILYACKTGFVIKRRRTSINNYGRELTI